MKVNFKIWRQAGGDEKGAFQTYPLDNVTEEMSLLEAIDILNEQLVHDGAEPVAFDMTVEKVSAGPVAAWSTDMRTVRLTDYAVPASHEKF